MDFKLIGTSFALIFLAELGDKTQLATLAMAASGQARLAVFLGAAGALIATSAIAAFGGEAIARVVPEVWIRRVGGVGFLVMGVLMLLDRD